MIIDYKLAKSLHVFAIFLMYSFTFSLFLPSRAAMGRDKNPHGGEFPPPSPPVGTGLLTHQTN